MLLNKINYRLRTKISLKKYPKCTCSPIAMYNILKWAKIKTYNNELVNEKFLKTTLPLLLNTEIPYVTANNLTIYGTNWCDSSSFIAKLSKDFKIKVKSKYDISIKEIDKHLDNNGIICVFDEEHVWLLIGTDTPFKNGERYYKHINQCFELPFICEKDLVKRLKYNKKFEYTEYVLLSK